MSDRIELDSVQGDALFVSDQRTVQGGDTYTFTFPVPDGAEPMDVVAVLVRVDRRDNA